MTAFTKPKRQSFKIDLPKSYKLMEWHFERYNLGVPKAAPHLKVKMPHIFLARELIRLYGMAFSRWQAANDYDVTLESVDDLPTLAVNNVFLGDVTGRTDRSIRNYRKVLQRAGFFVQMGEKDDGVAEWEVFHGRTCDFEVKISPDFLFVLHCQSTAQFRVANPLFSDRMRKSFPPTSTSTSTSTQEQLELVGGKLCSEQPEQPELSVENVPEQPEQPEQVQERGPQLQAVQETRTTFAAGANQIKLAELTKTKCRVLVNAAKTYLYPDEHWATAYRADVLEALASLYQGASEDKLDKITLVYRERIKLAQLYWAKEFGPLPPPDQFFRADNPDGFRKTKGWLDNPNYPPPPRQTYRVPNRRRGAGPMKLGDLI